MVSQRLLFIEFLKLCLCREKYNGISWIDESAGKFLVRTTKIRRRTRLQDIRHMLKWAKESYNNVSSKFGKRTPEPEKTAYQSYARHLFLSALNNKVRDKELILKEVYPQTRMYQFRGNYGPVSRLYSSDASPVPTSNNNGSTYGTSTNQASTMFQPSSSLPPPNNGSTPTNDHRPMAPPPMSSITLHTQCEQTVEIQSPDGSKSQGYILSSNNDKVLITFVANVMNIVQLPRNVYEQQSSSDVSWVNSPPQLSPQSSFDERVASERSNTTSVANNASELPPSEESANVSPLISEQTLDAHEDPMNPPPQLFFACKDCEACQTNTCQENNQIVSCPESDISDLLRIPDSDLVPALSINLAVYGDRPSDENFPENNGFSISFDDLIESMDINDGDNHKQYNIQQEMKISNIDNSLGIATKTDSSEELSFFDEIISGEK